jgi:hypothetical protein
MYATFIIVLCELSEPFHARPTGKFIGIRVLDREPDGN